MARNAGTRGGEPAPKRPDRRARPIGFIDVSQVPDPDLLTIKQSAAIIGCSSQLVRRSLLDSGVLCPVTRVKSRHGHPTIYLSRTNVEAYAAAHDTPKENQ
jgi:hypothetical protein